MHQCKSGLRQLIFIASTVSLLWVGVADVAAASSHSVAGVTPEFSSLIARCAPTVHPETMAALISAESRGHQYAIADAGPKNLPWSQRKHLVQSYYMGSLDAAVAKATELIANGHTVSLGLSQVNDRNLAGFGLSVRDVFEPCTNLAVGGKIITEFYEKASRQFGPGQQALRAAISGYNSGSWVRGEKDGYVNLVFNQRGKTLALRTEGPQAVKFHSATARAAGVQRTFAMSSSGFVVGE